MIDPQRLVDELVKAGWTVVGTGRHGSYKRLVWPGCINRGSLLVPLDTTAPEFKQLWDAALAQLEDAINVGAKAAYVLAGIHPIANS